MLPVRVFAQARMNYFSDMEYVLKAEEEESIEADIDVPEDLKDYR